MRLIDADALKQIIDKKETWILELIDEQPTAYDVEKVVAEFEKKGIWHSSICKDDIYSPLQKITVGEAIDIVKKGGAE